MSARENRHRHSGKSQENGYIDTHRYAQTFIYIKINARIKEGIARAKANKKFKIKEMKFFFLLPKVQANADQNELKKT